ncbi:MAG: peptidylprolyl isomerase [Acidobacteriota bacterium]
MCKPTFAVPVVLVFGALSAGCGDRMASQAPVTADTWAVVDGRQIRRDDVEKALRMAQPNQTLSGEEALAARLSLLDEMIVQDILVARAAALNITVGDAELDTAFAEGRKNLTDDEFQKELSRRNLTAADMRDGLRRELLVRKVMEREVTSKITVSDKEIEDFYAANRAQFNLVEPAYHIAQIAVTPGRDGQVTNRTGDDAITPETAQKKAQMLMEKLKGGAPFDELARDYSEDPESAPRGGDLGFMPQSALNQAPPALRDAVLKATPGTVSVVSGGGAHTLVLLVAKEEAGQRDLATVRDRIAGQLRGRKEQLLRTAYLAAAQTDADVVNYLARRIVESPGTLPNLGPQGPGSP